MFNRKKAEAIARDFLLRMNPTYWDGSGSKPGIFDTRIQEYEIGSINGNVLDLSFEFDETDGWMHYCELRDKETEDVVIPLHGYGINSVACIADSIMDVCSDENPEYIDTTFGRMLFGDYEDMLLTQFGCDSYDEYFKKLRPERPMNKDAFFEYLCNNFTLSGEARRLINSILDYVATQGWSRDEQHTALSFLLDGIGLEKEEIEKVCLYGVLNMGSFFLAESRP